MCPKTAVMQLKRDLFNVNKGNIYLYLTAREFIWISNVLISKKYGILSLTLQFSMKEFRYNYVGGLM